ncbi:MAG: hypothetical protein WA110_06775 [Anaerolineaceae bacterium]
MSKKTGKVRSIFRIRLVILIMEVILPFLLYLALQAGKTSLAVTLSALLAAGLIAVVVIK